MKKTKFIITLLMAVLMTFSSAFCVSVSAASSPDEAVISGNYDGIEPIPTEKPEDKPVKHGKGFSSGDYALFYTQTTFLALLAGYLIFSKLRVQRQKRKCTEENLTESDKNQKQKRIDLLKTCQPVFYFCICIKTARPITVGLIIYALSALNSLAFFKAASFCFFFLITLSRLNSSRSFSSSASEMNLTVSSKRGIIMFLRAFALF